MPLAYNDETTPGNVMIPPASYPHTAATESSGSVLIPLLIIAGYGVGVLLLFLGGRRFGFRIGYWLTFPNQCRTCRLLNAIPFCTPYWLLRTHLRHVSPVTNTDERETIS